MWRRAGALLAALVPLLLGGCALFNTPPIALAIARPSEGQAPLAVRFDASSSYDPDGDTPVAYQWQFGDGVEGSGCTTTHIYTEAGRYDATLTVIDRFGERDSWGTSIAVYAPPSVPEPDPEPQPTVGTVPFARTSDGFWAFVWHCQAQWRYEEDWEGELVQSPMVSYGIMRGDCDDFATMIAGYAAEYWGYAAYVAFLEFVDDVDHAVAFVRVCDYATLEWYFGPCEGGWPYFEWDGYFLPIDMARCVWWHWVEFGGQAVFRWWEPWSWWVNKPKVAVHDAGRSSVGVDAVPRACSGDGSQAVGTCDETSDGSQEASCPR
jgi:hypothetical protein